MKGARHFRAASHVVAAHGRLAGQSIAPTYRRGPLGGTAPLRQFSVSAADVEKFNAVHADWWKPSKNPLISMNATRVQYIRQQVAAAVGTGRPSPGDDDETTLKAQAPLTTLRALDIGCGEGLLSESLAPLGTNVTGIDPSADLVAAAATQACYSLLPTVRLEYGTLITVFLTDISRLISFCCFLFTHRQIPAVNFIVHL